MRLSAGFLLVATTLFGQAAAHGYVPFIRINGQQLPGWDVAKDPYTNPQPLRIVRATKNDSGFVASPSSAEITCSIGNTKLPSGPIHAEVAAGGTVTAVWNTWPTGHFGPVLNYMARCPNDNCSSFKGDSGNPWFKISQSTYENGQWASDKLAKTPGFTWDIKIPRNIAPGYYILRHENLALHGGTSVGGAQFYPVCIQLKVTGGGSLTPSGLGFPGAYNANDPGIHFNPYQGEAANKAYIAPGGPVYAGLQF